MLSRDLFRDEPEKVREALANRNMDPALLDEWLQLDAERRAALVEVEELKRQRNEASRAIGKVKQQGGDASEEIAAVGRLKERIEELEARLAALEPEMASIELAMPNLPHESVPAGKDEAANRCERVVGTPRVFGFAPKAHWDLGPALGILDFERGAKVAGARFTAYFGAGARLERALINLMLDLHTREHGYTEVLPPFIVNRESLTGTGQLPKFEQDLFHLDGTNYFLVPTAEVPLTNLHRDEILDEERLPIRYTAYTPCFRSEAGSYGKDVRGLIRQHQFNKVELVHLTSQETSFDALEELDQERREGAPAPRHPLPGDEPLDGRPRVLRGQDLRPGGLAARAERLPGDLLLQQLHGLPGPARQPPLPSGRWRQDAPPAHPERLGPGGGADAGGDPGEFPGGGRLGRDPRGPAAVRRRPGADYAAAVSCCTARRRGG